MKILVALSFIVTIVWALDFLWYWKIVRPANPDGGFLNEVRDRWSLVLGVGFVAVLMLWLSSLIFWGVYIGCRNTADAAGLEYQWHISTDCLVKFDGQWVPYDRWIQIRGENP